MDWMEAIRKRKEVEAKIIGAAMQDKDLRRKLVEDPAAAVKKIMGAEVPDEVEITVVEESPRKFILALPYVPEGIDVSSKVSDEELEKVAGGVGLAVGVFADTCVAVQVVV